MAGATAFKGAYGFGASSVIYSYKFWEVDEKVPVVVEIIDQTNKIEAFFDEINPILNNMRYGCIVTIEDVTIKLYKSGKKK